MGQPSALNISEILLQVLEYVDEYDPVALPTAIRVNRQWFICGTDILWRNGTCDALAMVSKSRRQIYASKMASLDFSDGDWTAYHSRFKHLEFTTLRDVSIGSHGPQSGRQLRPYLQSSLEHLCFNGRHLDTELVQHLQTHCCRLRCIIIDSHSERVTAECFSNFLTSCKYLQRIKILRGLEHLLTDELMLHLAGRSNLLSLGTTKTFSVRLLQQILAQVNQPFRALDDFHTAVTSAAVPLVVSFAANFTSLHLEVRDAGDTVIGHISSLTNLHVLSLYFAAPTKLSRQHLVSLKNLSKLHTLDIRPYDDESASELTAFESGFTDADFIDMISQY